MRHNSRHRGYVLEASTAQRGSFMNSRRLLEVGLETALWPDLHFSEELLDTRWAGRESAHASAKRSYLTKLGGPVLDYQFNFGLLQWQYDRHMPARFAGRGLQASRDLRWKLADIPEA
eukprot:1291192-Pyramimonas_sp.AAC.1